MNSKIRQNRHMFYFTASPVLQFKLESLKIWKSALEYLEIVKYMAKAL